MNWIQSLIEHVQGQAAIASKDQVKIPEDVLRAWESVQGVKKDRKDAFILPKEIFPVTAAVEKNKKAELKPDVKVGDLVEGEGVFLCQYRLLNAKGKYLGRIFNVYAAPEDLKDEGGSKTLMGFSETVSYVSTLKNWHGHNGGYYYEEAALCKALKKRNYHGEWVIPPKKILMGETIQMQPIKGALYDARDTGRFANTFEKFDRIEKGVFPTNYWSCTPYEHAGHYRWAANFGADYVEIYDVSGRKMRCRPIRFVEVKT